MKRGIFIATLGSAALTACGGGGAGSSLLPSTQGSKGQQPASIHQFGIQIHPYAPDEPATDLPLIIASGATYCRCDLAWDLIENPAGTFDWSLFDTIYGNMLANNIIPIWLTGIGNPEAYGFGTGINAPITSTQIQQYVTFHTLAAQRYPRAWWEICNEPNIEYFWPPNPDPTQYAALVAAVAPAIRANISSTSKILSAGTSGIPISFIQTFLNAGVAGLVDYVAFHPYGIEPSALPASLSSLHSSTPLPLFCSEYGTTDLTTQASDLTNMAMACGNNGIPFMWYELLDGVPNTIDPVNTFGLYTMELAPKPVLASAQNFASGNA